MMKVPTKEQFIQQIILDSFADHSKLNLIDATAGNGHDTFFLGQNFKKSNIITLDIQERALKNTKERCLNFKNITYVKADHANLEQAKELTHLNYVDLVIYNTGYLPQSDKKIQTNSVSTIKSLEFFLQKLQKQGLIILTIYRGHDESKEFKEVTKFLETLNKYEYIVFTYHTVNTINSPVVYVIEKK